MSLGQLYDTCIVFRSYCRLFTRTYTHVFCFNRRLWFSRIFPISRSTLYPPVDVYIFRKKSSASLNGGQNPMWVAYIYMRSIRLDFWV